MKRPQINVRLDEETQARLDHVRRAASELVGAPLTYSDVFRMALTELAKKYPAKKPKKSDY